MTEFVLYKPVVRSAQTVTPLAPRPADLAGRRIGLLFNTKSNGDVMLRRVQELLGAAYAGVTFDWVRKPHASQGMTPENFASLRRAGAVVTGLGD